MTATKQSTILGVFVFVLASVVLAGFWFTRQSAGRRESRGLDPGSLPAAIGRSSPELDEPLESFRTRPDSEPLDPAATTVIWPLELELSLIEAATYDEKAGLPPIGSGAHAGLRGSIHSADGQGVAATLEFLAGPNQGRVLRCDAEGKLGASNLYPGYSVIRIETPTGRVAVREPLLESYKTQVLNIGFGSPATVYGKVVDIAGEAIVGASIELDGQRALSDELGEFVVYNLAWGKALTIIEKPGYALYRETVPVPRGQVVTKDRLVFRLEAGADLEVTIAEAIGAPGPAQLFVLPQSPDRVSSVRGQRIFPWFRVSPVEIHPGGSVLIQGLPEGRVNLMLYHPGALAKPGVTTLKLVAGRPNQALLHLEPAPQISGVVRRGDQLVEGARVVLEAADRSAASRREVGGLPITSMIVMPHLPTARQEVRTDRRGLFVFTSYEGIDRYYLKATSADGQWRATQVVEAGAKDLELKLEAVRSELCELEVELPERFQSLPVSVRVDGQPRDPILLPMDEQLVVGELEAGTWRLDASWHGESLIRSQTLKLTRRSGLALRLPAGAVDGQTIEERKRAGRL